MEPDERTGGYRRNPFRQRRREAVRLPDATTGVVVLSGSSGRVDTARARLFAGEGASALALQWFGGEGQVPGICEILLETFSAATDFLVGLGCRRIVYVGTSKGAEASLLAATHARTIFMDAQGTPLPVRANRPQLEHGVCRRSGLLQGAFPALLENLQG